MSSPEEPNTGYIGPTAGGQELVPYQPASNGLEPSQPPDFQNRQGPVRIIENTSGAPEGIGSSPRVNVDPAGVISALSAAHASVIAAKGKDIQPAQPEAKTEPDTESDTKVADSTVEAMLHDTIRLGTMGRQSTAERGIKKPGDEAETRELPAADLDEEPTDEERFRQLADATIAGAVSEAATPRPVTRSEQRSLAKIGRRKQKAFLESAEQHRLGSVFGRTPGVRGPLFLRRTITHDSTHQQLARNNRFGRISDIDNKEAFERRLAEGDYSRGERKAERRGRKLFLISEEAQRDLNEANLATRNGTDTFKAKTRRLGRRVKRVVQRRSPYFPN
jgi:hypothetical protein